MVCISVKQMYTRGEILIISGLFKAGNCVWNLFGKSCTVCLVDIELS